ncbi:spatacsin-like [Brachionus plicatilis]|uniref:Spatacsin-like n=1 Tax=Brachionus plicatilis TaxID=10195 RepID=A0A3M7S5I7_BRAPC|nr:spatacsin-like [Brachionus plicatilis]
MKEDCVKQAEICIKKARLVALQIKILSTGIQIVNLNQTLVTKFLTEHAKFWEAYIVAEAYDRMTDLSLALFNQFVMNNNVKYFQDFKTYLTINQNTVEEIVNRYKLWISEGNSSEQQAIENIKILLKCCKDISFFYRMSSSLELTEWALNEASNLKFIPMNFLFNYSL